MSNAEDISDLHYYSSCVLMGGQPHCRVPLFNYVLGGDGRLPSNGTGAYVTVSRKYTNMFQHQQLADHGCSAWVDMVQGAVLEGGEEPRLSEALAAVTLDIEVSGRPVVSRRLLEITPVDSVLEARVRALEHLLVDDSNEKRRQILEKLGAESVPPLRDPRMLGATVEHSPYEVFNVSLHCPAHLPILGKVIWSMSVFGRERRPTW